MCQSQHIAFLTSPSHFVIKDSFEHFDSTILCTESPHAPINDCTRSIRILYRGKGGTVLKLLKAFLLIVFSFLNLKISFSTFTEQFLYKDKMYIKNIDKQKSDFKIIVII